ncbi:MAG: globin [Planctomycetota bacterium]
MTDSSEMPVYDRVGGPAIAAMVAEFYRLVPQDPVLGPLYPEHDLAAAEARLRDFLIYRLGGPPTYLQTRGHPRLRMRHAPFAIGRAERDRWVELMRAGMTAAGLPADVREWLDGFLGDIATFLVNRAG